MGGSAGLSIGLSALLAHRAVMDVIGQNLANVNTEGYSRQRLGLDADTTPVTSAIFSTYDGAAGQGVRIGELTRARDQFLEVRAHQEHATQSQLARTDETLSAVEKTFGEPSDQGLSALMADFAAAWSDLGNAPGELATRTQVVERGETLAIAVRQQDANLGELRRTTSEQLQTALHEVDVMASQFAELNDRIRAAQVGGQPANELRDQRDLLALKLADAVGATFRSQPDGTIDAYLGTNVLVRSNQAEQLQLTVDTTPAQNVSVTFASSGVAAAVGGKAAGSVLAVNDIVPRYRSALQGVATTLANEVNTLHRASYDRTGTAGEDFFVFGPNGLTVNPDLQADPAKVAASSIPGGNLDGAAARAMAKLSGAADQYRDVVVRIGVEAQAATRRSAVQDGVVKQIDASREAVSGVNMDEELTNMISAQRAYQAAARYVNAVDETLDTLVNRLGLAGR